MNKLVLIFLILFSSHLYGQKSGDTTYARCPVAITDTSGYNNYFISHQSAIVKVERIRNNIVITIQQKDQFFTMFFRVKRLADRKYSIVIGAGENDELDAKYSFRSGGRASYISVNSGTVEVKFNKETELWNLKINGLLKNLVERTVALYKVKADISFP